MLRGKAGFTVVVTCLVLLGVLAWHRHLFRFAAPAGLDALRESASAAVMAAQRQRAPLRLVAVSDLHGLWEEGSLTIPDGDVLVVAGDVELTYSAVAAAFNEWLARQPHKAKVVGFGNMDSWAESSSYDAKLLSSAVVLRNDGAEVLGYRFVGSPQTPKFYGAFQLSTQASAREHWARVLPPDAEVDVLVTHGPPHGFGDETNGRHVGDKALLDAVMALRRPPLVWIVGHIHSSYGKYEVPHPSGAVIPLLNSAMDYARTRPGKIKPHVIDLPSQKHV